MHMVHVVLVCATIFQFDLIPAFAVELGAGEGGGDSIELNNGAIRTIPKVTVENYITVGGNTKSSQFPACDVKTVTRENQPADLASGFDYMRRGEYRAAALFFARVLENASAEPWAKEYAAYYCGLAFFENGDFEANGYVGRTSKKQYPPTSALFAKALELNPKTRFLLDALVRRAEALGNEGKYEQAEAAFKDAEKRIEAYKTETVILGGNYEPFATEASVRLAIGHANMLEARESTKKDKAEWDPVLAAYRRAKRNTERWPDIAWRAEDGEIRMMVNLRDFDSATDLAQRILGKAQTGDLGTAQMALLPAAYSTLGRVHMRKAEDAEKAKNKRQAASEYAEARWNFLNVMVQSFDNPDLLARSNFFAGVCSWALREFEPDAANKARLYWSAAIKALPDSTWAKMASEEMNRLPAEAAKSAEPPVAEKKDAGRPEKTGPAKKN